MKPSPKQQILLTYAREHDGKITKSEANDLLRRYYYHNHDHYVSEILSRMIKSGLLIRESKGHYNIPTEKKVEQVELF